MKINWGTGIVIAFILFIGFIMYMVVTMMSGDKYSHDLVTEEYYKKEINYQEEIDAEKNAQLLSENIKVKTSLKGVEIIFPKDLNFENIEGSISFYRPSSKKLDFSFPIELSSHSLLIPDDKVLEGSWGITIVWKYEGVNYMFKDKIVY
tara:strand:- start:21324 stop:21770 length:447 start_codon:yes stop_codon:yes gene_type:complete